MGESEIEVVEISPCSLEKEKRVIEKQEEEGTPLRPVLCLKTKEDMKYFDMMEDCYMLDFDPFESVDMGKSSVSETLHFDYDDDDDDISIIAEKGQVACRDYPHARHLCLKFPFDSTPHESYCKLMQCYCYVCDSAAPCVFWNEPEPGHCHATEHFGDRKSRRIFVKQEAV